MRAAAEQKGKRQRIFLNNGFLCGSQMDLDSVRYFLAAGLFRAETKRAAPEYEIPAGSGLNPRGRACAAFYRWPGIPFSLPTHLSYSAGCASGWFAAYADGRLLRSVGTDRAGPQLERAGHGQGKSRAGDAWAVSMGAASHLYRHPPAPAGHGGCGGHRRYHDGSGSGHSGAVAEAADRRNFHAGNFRRAIQRLSTARESADSLCDLKHRRSACAGDSCALLLASATLPLL